VIVGIDLGTTNSLISIYHDGVTVLIPNVLGHFLTPSAVSVDDDGALLVGLAARERLSTHPGSTAIAFKRWMGSDYLSKLGNRTMRAEELSAVVLKALKVDAEAFLGEPVTEAVITVPAYFNDVQRRATKTAGELAGFKVERLLNEPTAAGLAYGLQERVDHTTFLVFDLGGGTFDVSVLTYFEGVVEVHASAGDTRLGGDDFVAVLVDWFVEKTLGLSTEDKNEIIMGKALWRTAENAKRELSQNETATLSFIRRDQLFALTVTRLEYEQRCEPLLRRLRKPIERALMDARLAPGELSEVIMAGGASRMPMVRQLVTRLFGRLPLRTVNPDETVARGAAIQAALKARDCSLQEIVLTDVMPFSLGIVVREEINNQWIVDRFSPIIERNTAIPVSRVKSYNATSRSQTSLELDVRQGESPVGSENLQLGTLMIAIPWAERGVVNIDVRFTYDINGLLEVEAYVAESGQTSRTVIQRSSDGMSQAQIAQSLEKMQALKIHPRDKQENIYLVERAKRIYADRLGEERQAVAQALLQFEIALNAQDEHIIREHSQRFREFMDRIDRSFVL
jgi:molecular chaperone HscC